MMDFFFVEYRDPLVGLIFLTILIFVVAVANVIWKFFASRDEEEKLERFVKKFEISSIHQDLLRDKALSPSNLIFLGDIFTKSGEFEKSTQIYLIALEKTRDKNEREAIFLALAKVYFKAGFLERSREVLLNSLKIRPRNKEILELLKLVYLKLKLYKENLETLECLFELGEDIKDEREFIKALMIEAKFKQDQQKDEFLKLDFQNNTALLRMFYEKHKIFYPQKLENIIDLLYRDKKIINLDDENYQEFFSALRLCENPSISFKNPHFKMLHILKENQYKTRLEFSYFCLECKSTMPLFFYHCPLCYAFNRCKIFYEVKSDEEA